MTDETPSGDIRRVSARDRKARLEAIRLDLSARPQPPDVPEPPPEPAPAQDAPDSADAPVLPFSFEYPQEWRSRDSQPLEADDAALLDAIEEDTSALLAITPAEEAAARQARARRPAPPPATPLPVRVPPARRRRALLANLLTALFAVGDCGLLTVFAVIWQNPFSALNPRPPLTPVPIVVSMTPTPTLTPIPSATPTPSPTPPPTDTPPPSPTPTDTPVPGTPTPVYGFTVPLTLGSQQVYISNPETRGGCRWSSLAGTVAGADGAALNGYQVRVLGDGIDETLISGSAAGFGPGGFELPLGYEARDAQFAIQLLDAAGTPVSPVYTVTTSSRCDWNISIVRFQQAAPAAP
jgi:hypothetical protein